MRFRETTETGRLLVVDDDEQIRTFLGALLRGIGYVVEQAGSAEEALERLRSAPDLDLVLLDLKLPGRSGHAVLEEIRGNPHMRLLPVVMLTGYASREDKMKAIQAGVTDFVTKPFSPDELVTRVRALVQLKAFTDGLEDPDRIILTMAKTIDARDPYTAGHSEHVASYARMLGERVGLKGSDLHALQSGALFHDFGKIAVRDGVLLKPGTLTAAEFGEIKRHPIEGRNLLKHMKTLAAAMEVVLYHHERLDGSGYPEGLVGDSIPLNARITTIADVFDALTTDRVYRQAMSREDALEVMRDSVKKGWWDGRLLDEFIGVLDRLPENDPRRSRAARQASRFMTPAPVPESHSGSK